MTEELAWTILVTITVIGGVFWLATTTWFIRLVRDATSAPSDVDWNHLDEPGWKPDGGNGSGQVEVKGEPVELAAALAADLGRHGINGVPVRLLDVAESRVRFEILGLINPVGRPGGSLGKSRIGEVDFQARRGGMSVADFRLEPQAGRGLLIAGGIFSVLGLVALIVGFLALSTLAVPNPRPGVRGQVVQMVQCVHFLWPPWLFGMIYRRTNDAYRQAVVARIANLPYL